MFEVIKLFLIFLKFHAEARQKTEFKDLKQKELDELYKNNFLQSLKKLRQVESTKEAEDSIDSEYKS